MTGTICPFLGRADDRETAFAFNSPGNRCYKMDNPVSISLTHQNTYCLSDTYTQCPVFLRKPQENAGGVNSEVQPIPLAEIDTSSDAITPQNSFIRNIQFRKRSTAFYTILVNHFNRLIKPGSYSNPAVPVIFITSLAILIIALLFLILVAISSFSSPRLSHTTAAINTTPSSVIRPEIFLITLTPTFRSAFATEIGITDIQPGILLEPLDTPTPLTIVVTPTIAPAVPQYHACGAPAQWVPYIVQDGDSLTLLSLIYDVPLFELSSNNCLGVTDNLYIGAEIYVPFALPTPTSNP